MKVNPLDNSGASGGQANVNYTWLFAGVGTEYSAGVNAAVSKDLGSDGEYSITMRAVVAQTGCECSVTKKFVLNRAGMEELSKVGVTVFPNPASSDVKVMVSENLLVVHSGNAPLNIRLSAEAFRLPGHGLYLAGRVGFEPTSSGFGVRCFAN